MGKCRFRTEWLEKTDTLGHKISKWARKGMKDDELYCVVCCVSVNVGKGFQSVTQHYTGKKHITNVKLKLDASQCRLVIDIKNSSGSVRPCVTTGASEIKSDLNILDTSCSLSSLEVPSSSSQTPPMKCNSSQVNSAQVSSLEYSTPGQDDKILRFCNPLEAAIKAEIIWTMTVIAKNFSAQSCQNIGEVFCAMFPALVPKDFSLSPKKLSYLVTEALGPYFKDSMLQEAKKTYFSIQYDETTNNKGKKELQINIRYWSDVHNEVVIHHLETIFIGKASADVLATSILSALNKGSLSLKNVVTVGSDGPKVNHKVFTLLNEQIIAARGKSLLDIGTCNLHHVHNAFLKGLEAFGTDVSDLVICVYYFFHGWPSRKEDYVKSQKKVKVPEHSFIKHSQTRWLTLKEAASRLLEQWPALQDYFVKFLPLQKTNTLFNSASCKKICSFLKKSTMRAEILFVVSSSEIFSSFCTIFQKEEPLIHALQTELDVLISKLMGRVCKGDLTSGKDIPNNVFDKENLQNATDIQCGHSVEEALSNVNERERLEFRFSVQKHYSTAGKYLLSKSHKMLKHFSCFQPMLVLNPESLQSIAEIARVLPGEINVDLLLDEWRLLKSEKDVISFIPGQRIDHFWRNIFQLKNAVGAEKYPIVQEVVKMCLCISHGSADVERGFSLSSRILTDERSSMTERTLNARLSTIDGLRVYGNNPVNVPITRQLILSAVNAHKSYKLYLEEKKRNEESERIKAEDDRKKREADEESRKEVKRMKHSVEELKKKLDEVNKLYKLKKETSEKMHEEANKRLKKALSKTQVDVQEVSLAQAMYEGAQLVKNEEQLLSEKVASLQSELDRKTNKLLSTI